MSKKPNSFNFVRFTLRKASLRWPARSQVLKEAKHRVEIGTYKNGNTKFKTKYQCNNCKELFDKVEVDHIHGVIENRFTTWDDFINRLFCPKEELQVLCRECHLNKTNKEK